MKVILGRKLGMTQVFKENGQAMPVTVVLAGPVFITQVKTSAGKDKYNAICVGMEKDKKGFRFEKEFRISDKAIKNVKVNQEIGADNFKVGDKVKVSGISKGKGFQGVVKRHNFAGSPRTHGHRHDLRSGGSIGSAYPQKVFKGQKMAGRMGYEQVTTKKVEVVEVKPKENLLFLKGGLPGSKGGLLKISGV